jgi:tetratricopeptide (TPR) repeat protein
MVIDSLLKKGQGAVTAKDARNAMTIAEQLLRGNPNDPDGVALKAAALGMMGKPEEAIAYLEGLRSKSSTQRFLHLQALADAYQDAKQPEKAKQINEEILSLAGSTAEDKKEARSRMLDLEWDSLLASGEKALAANKLDEATNALAQLETLKPKSVDLLWFRAAILGKEGRWQEAAATYEECKLRQGAAFDANSSLGSAYANSGRWQEATDELSIAENDPRQDKITRFEAGRISRIMKERIRPTLASRYEASDGQEGISYRSSTELSSGIIGGNNIFYLRTNTDYLRLKESTVKRSREERYEAEVAYRRLLSNGYYGEVSAGAHQDGGMYGAKIGRYEGPGFAWDFSLNKNARATDSLPLEAINGRQDAIAFTVSTEFSRNFYMDARFFLRNVHVDGHDLGDGYGMQANVGYAVLNETTTRPEVSLNYFNEISRFNPRTLSNDFVSRYGSGNSDLSFIDEKINRHGVSITIAKHITPQMLAYFYGGVGYEFESAQAENRLGAGVDVQIGNNTSLNIGVDYTSSGNTGNRGDDVFSGTVSVKHSF